MLAQLSACQLRILWPPIDRQLCDEAAGHRELASSNIYACYVHSYKVCARVDARVLALGWRFPALRMYTRGAIPLDMSVYAGGSHVPALGSVDHLALCPFVAHNASSADCLAHLVYAPPAVPSKLPLVCPVPVYSAQSYARMRLEVQHRTVSRAAMRPLTQAERCDYETWLNGFEVVPEVFGCPVKLSSVHERNGLARVELGLVSRVHFSTQRNHQSSPRAAPLGTVRESR